MFIRSILCLVLLGITAATHRAARTPKTTHLMFSGFYGNSREYIPAAMTAFLAGNPHYRTLQEEDPAEETTDIEITTTTKPRRLPKKKPVPQPAEEDSQEDSNEDNSWLRGFNRNTFFPVIFGGYPGAKGADAGGYPGAATAIANSFSTGKGGVASSHATAFGDPALSSLLKNGNFKRRGGDE